MTRPEDPWTGGSRHPDLPLAVMPDYDNQNQDLLRQSQTLPTRSDVKAAPILLFAREMAKAPGSHPRAEGFASAADT